MKVKITGNRGFLGQYLSKFYEGSLGRFNQVEWCIANKVKGMVVASSDSI